ncbi:MAG TPA: hypothetical protein VGG33_11660, partial [Polyangia bacterium]
MDDLSPRHPICRRPILSAIFPASFGGRLSGALALALPFALPLVALGGCATNPLTGKDDFALLPEEMEIEAGETVAAR